ncbi:MAG: DUF2007 domain-containing protein [Edaphobacter sp.]
MAEFIEPVYAQLAKGALESAGIECFLQGEHINNLQMGVAFSAELQVHKQDEEAARQILDASEEEPDASDSIDEKTDERADERDDQA